jgi:hypothetical protein
VAHDREAYAKAKAIMEKYWPKYTDETGRRPMCSIDGDYVRSHIEQEMALEFERLGAENRTLRNVGISQLEQINRLLAQQTNN